MRLSLCQVILIWTQVNSYSMLLAEPFGAQSRGTVDLVAVPKFFSNEFL